MSQRPAPAGASHHGPGHDGPGHDGPAPAGAVRDAHGRLQAPKTRDVTVVGPLGGAGAAHAAAAARRGRSTALVAVGDAGAPERAVRAALAAAGVEVAPGPGDRLDDAARVRDAAALVSGARVVLLRCEAPDAVLLAAARLCTGLLVLDPAPPRPLPPELLRRTDLLVPGAAELAVLAGEEPAADVEGLVRQARAVRPDGTSVVTRGARGCVVVTPAGVAEVPAVPAGSGGAGAGGGFVAALTDALLRGAGLVQAARAAVAAGRDGPDGHDDGHDERDERGSGT
ncbi:PfkB family carbohydrate kinase [Kineococcus sp. SYSU DK005]|uniref:PfkB family carbohydrate kinase n=1 Tax=Kineococcus sp. SYSU DK005 TaxID=3383126 RepID=UPI003D7E263A